MRRDGLECVKFDKGEIDCGTYRFHIFHFLAEAIYLVDILKKSAFKRNELQ